VHLHVVGFPIEIDLTNILSTTDMAPEKSCDIDPDWEHSSTVRRA